MTLGNNIKTQRKRAGLSQEKVAELVGVTRQAVTKWETGQSAPGTENLCKLAEAFGTSVDALLDTSNDAAQVSTPARAGLRTNLLAALGIAGGYLLVYLAGRVFGYSGEQTSVMGWLFGTDPTQLSYVYGWLLQRRLFWVAMAVSVIPALFGKVRFSVITLLGFAAGLLLGELFGHCPAGAAFGHGHYGWLIWGVVFLCSMVVGIVFEQLGKHAKKATAKRARAQARGRG